MNKKTFLRKLCIAFALVMSLSILTPLESQAAMKNSMGNFVKLYRQGKYSQAKKMAKKLPKKASKKYAKNMSKKMKGAYLKTVKSFKTSGDYMNPPKKGYIWGYYLTDINNDKKTDLIVHHGTSAVNEWVSVYTYKKGKAKKVGTRQVRSVEFFDYPGKKGVVVTSFRKYEENIHLIKVKGNKLVMEKVATRSVPSGKYIKMPYRLNDHRYSMYSTNLNLSDLK